RRADVFADNLVRLRKVFARCPDDVALVRTRTEYERARRDGRHAAFIGIQGGNALGGAADALARIADDAVLRITLVHLTSSEIGATSSPFARFGNGPGLTPFGRDYVARLNA